MLRIWDGFKLLRCYCVATAGLSNPFGTHSHHLSQSDQGHWRRIWFSPIEHLSVVVSGIGEMLKLQEFKGKQQLSWYDQARFDPWWGQPVRPSISRGQTFRPITRVLNAAEKSDSWYLSLLWYLSDSMRLNGNIHLTNSWKGKPNFPVSASGSDSLLSGPWPLPQSRWAPPIRPRSFYAILSRSFLTVPVSPRPVLLSKMTDVGQEKMVCVRVCVTYISTHRVDT